jgi:hypothetical protein
MHPNLAFQNAVEPLFRATRAAVAHKVLEFQAFAAHPATGNYPLDIIRVLMLQSVLPLIMS